MENKLNARDFINIGIFTALYFVIVFIVAFIGYVPILMDIMPAVCALFGAIPFMLFLTRTKKFGMVTIMAVILGLLTLLLGRPWPAIVIAAVAGLLADFYLKSTGYSSRKKAVVGCGIFSLWMVGMALPMFFGYRDAYMESLRPGYGDAYVDQITALTPSWVFWALVVTIFLGGLIGALIGGAILKKHFLKAGMA